MLKFECQLLDASFFPAKLSLRGYISLKLLFFGKYINLKLDSEWGQPTKYRRDPYQFIILGGMCGDFLDAFIYYILGVILDLVFLILGKL